MVSLLNNRPLFLWRNYSVPTSKAFEGLNNAQLREQLGRQIAPTQCVIIIGGMWTNHSDWIQHEIEVARAYGKPILGVRPRSAKVMPTAVIMASHKVVNWNGDSIIAGIREISG